MKESINGAEGILGYPLINGRGLFCQRGIQITAQHLHNWGYKTLRPHSFFCLRPRTVSYWLALVLSASPDYPTNPKGQSPHLYFHFILVTLAVRLYGSPFCFFWGVKCLDNCWTDSRKVLHRMNCNNCGDADFFISDHHHVKILIWFERPNACKMNNITISLSCSLRLVLFSKC